MAKRRWRIDARSSRHSRPYNQGPDLADSRPRDEIQAGLRSLHVARKGRRGRHIILYRSDQPGTVEIVRIIHDSMDIARQVSPGESAEVRPL